MTSGEEELSEYLDYAKGYKCARRFGERITNIVPATGVSQQVASGVRYRVEAWALMVASDGSARVVGLRRGSGVELETCDSLDHERYVGGE